MIGTPNRLFLHNPKFSYPQKPVKQENASVNFLIIQFMFIKSNVLVHNIISNGC